MKFLLFLFGLLPIIFGALGTVFLLRGAGTWEVIFEKLSKKDGLGARFLKFVFEDTAMPSDTYYGLILWFVGIISQVFYLIITI